MKKVLKLFALSALICTSLLPFGIQKAQAVSYYPGYTCYYRDMSGTCLSYQHSRPVHLGVGTSGQRPLYGNRQTYPFRAMFNAYSTHKSSWDNRYSNYRNSINPYYRAYRYEEDDDDNDYLDEDDDAYYYYYGKKHHKKDDGKWRWYYDEDVDYVNPYRYQSDDDDGYSYDDDDWYHSKYDDDDDWHHSKYDDDDDWYENDEDDYFEYDRNIYYCTGRHCKDNYYRY